MPNALLFLPGDDDPHTLQQKRITGLFLQEWQQTLYSTLYPPYLDPLGFKVYICKTASLADRIFGDGAEQS